VSRDGLDFSPRLGLTLPLCGLHFIFFLLAASDAVRTYSIFAFQPQLGFTQPWTFLTYQFLHQSPIGLFFGTMILYIFGTALEAEWGTGYFTVFWLVATLGGSLAALALSQPLSGWQAVDTSLLFAFAYLFPETVFYILFVLPLKVKWLAWITAAYLVFSFVSLTLRGAPLAALVQLVGTSAGFLYFWVRHQALWRARKAGREAVAAVKSAGAVREDQALEKRNRELFPRVAARRVAIKTGAVPVAGPLEVELQRLVVPGVKICKPIDFKGDKDGVCVKCEGFAECSMRYLAGQPEEIVMKSKE
jgi:membrane associated rhomboid family serine protease